jgi:hypothetical protein
MKTQQTEIAAIIAEMRKYSGQWEMVRTDVVEEWADRLAVLSSQRQETEEALKVAREYVTDDRHDYPKCRRLLQNLVAAFSETRAPRQEEENDDQARVGKAPS